MRSDVDTARLIRHSPAMPVRTRFSFWLVIEATTLATVAGGLVEAMLVWGMGTDDALGVLGLWVGLAPAVAVGVTGLALLARSAATRAMVEADDGPAWPEAVATVAAAAALALALFGGRLADVATSRLNDPGLMEPVLRVGLAVAGLGLLAAAWIAVGPIARGLGRLPPTTRRVLVGVFGIGAAAAVVAGPAARMSVGASALPLLLAAVVGGVAVARLVGGGAPPRWRVVGGILALLGLAGAGGGAFATSADVRAGVDEAEGLARWVAAGLRRVADRDGDGFDAVLGGGDCNDADPTVHPLAVDLPGNGVDEDCSGTDRPRPSRHVGPIKHHARPDALKRRKANLLLITVDTLRPDRLGAYGHDRPTSPAIDRLAAAGVVFERAYSPAPATRHALPAMLAGRRIDFMRTRREGTTVVYEPGNDLLFERLVARGYATEAHLSAYFDRHLELGLGAGIERVVPVADGVRATLTAVELTDNVIASIDGRADALDTRPWAIWVHYTEPHAPYSVHEGIDFGDRPIDRYDGEIRRLDIEIGRLLTAIDDRGLRGRTVVALTSDHGEEFGEHGGQFHGKRVYEESIRVPWIIRAPGIEPGRVPEPVGLVDLTPTLANMLGASRGPAHGARSQLDRMTGAERPARDRELFVECILHDDRPARRLVALIQGQTKFILDLRNGSTRLYDLETDPGEQQSLHTVQADRAKRLADRVRARIARTQAAVMADLLDRRVYAGVPDGVPVAEAPLVPGLTFVGSAVERFSAHQPVYAARVWLRAEDARRPDYVLRVEWFDAGGRRVRKRDLRPLAGRYPTHRWVEGQVVETMHTTTLKRGRPPYTARLSVVRGSKVVAEPRPLGTTDEVSARR